MLKLKTKINREGYVDLEFSRYGEPVMMLRLPLPQTPPSNLGAVVMGKSTTQFFLDTDSGVRDLLRLLIEFNDKMQEDEDEENKEELTTLEEASGWSTPEYICNYADNLIMDSYGRKYLNELIKKAMRLEPPAWRKLNSIEEIDNYIKDLKAWKKLRFETVVKTQVENMMIDYLQRGFGMTGSKDFDYLLAKARVGADNYHQVYLNLKELVDVYQLGKGSRPGPACG